MEVGQYILNIRGERPTFHSSKQLHPFRPLVALAVVLLGNLEMFTFLTFKWEIFATGIEGTISIDWLALFHAK